MRISIMSALVALAFGCASVAAIRADEGTDDQLPTQLPVVHGDREPGGGRASAIGPAQARLSLALLTTLAAARRGHGGDNIIISPASLASTLGLVGQGADKAMTDALAKALSFDASVPPESALDMLIRAHASWSEDSAGTIKAAGRLVLDPNVRPYPLALKGIKSSGADITFADLSQAKAVEDINAWVDRATGRRIHRILDAPLDKPAFVALDALYFKGTWRRRFDPSETKPAPFTPVSGKPTEVAMMHLAEGRYDFRTDNDHVGVELPFEGDRFSLIVVTTKARPAKLTEFDKVAGWLTGEQFSPHLGSVDLPRLSLSGREELLPALDALGLAAGRRSPTALGGFGAGATLARVTQQAVLEVDEQGAEAAAATAAVGDRSFGQEDKVHMSVDKPFVYALRDRRTGLVVVAGYVGSLPPGNAR